MSELEPIRPVSPKFHPSYLVREAALQTPKLPGDSPEAPFGALAGVPPAIVGAAGTKVVTGDGEPANSRALPGSSICMHVCMHACMHMYVCMYVSIYIYMYVCISVYLSICIYDMPCGHLSQKLGVRGLAGDSFLVGDERLHKAQVRSCCLSSLGCPSHYII